MRCWCAFLVPLLAAATPRMPTRLELSARGQAAVMIERALVRSHRPEKTDDWAEEDVGGSASRNAFLGEEQFLRESSDIAKKKQEQKLRQDQDAARAAQNVARAADVNNGDVVDLDLDLAAARGTLGKNLISSGHNVFASEQPFLKAVSEETAMPIKWARHPNLCVCGEPASRPGGNATLVIWDCNDAAKASNMKFLLPTGEAADKMSHGQIKWAADPTKCMYVRNGWAGNGNHIYLWSCADATNIQSMNFSVFTPPTSGRSSIAWARKPSMYPSKCLDVHNEKPFNGNQVELWDCNAGATWEIY